MALAPLSISNVYDSLCSPAFLKVPSNIGFMPGGAVTIDKEVADTRLTAGAKGLNAVAPV